MGDKKQTNAHNGDAKKGAQGRSRTRTSGPTKKKNEWAGLFWTLLLILFARAFIAEPYKIPSGSMIPTLLIGDHILVSKSSYDLRVPFTDIQFARVSDPQRGDVIVFAYPNYERNRARSGDFFIKRLIGVPGDTVSITRGEISINGQSVLRTPLEKDFVRSRTPDYEYSEDRVAVFHEQLPGMREPHLSQNYKRDLAQVDVAIDTWKEDNLRKCRRNKLAESGGQGNRAQIDAECASMPSKTCVEMGDYIVSGVRDSSLMNQICEFTIPEDKYFVMGDNRDDSSDGRAWGYVPRELLKGKALFIWLPWKGRVPGNWDYTLSGEGTEGGPLLRWSRFAMRII